MCMCLRAHYLVKTEDREPRIMTVVDGGQRDVVLDRCIDGVWQDENKMEESNDEPITRT